MSIVGTSKDDAGNVRMGAFWKVGHWDRQNATAQYIEQLQKFADAYKAKQPSAADYYSSFLASTDKSLVQDADILRDVIDAGEDYATTLDTIAKKKQEAIKQNTGFAASMKGLGNIMKSVGASLLSGALYAGINWALGKAWELADQQINAAKYAKEALQEVSAQWDELNAKQKSAGDLVEKYEADYERLSKGVNMVTGENLTLTDDEYELFKQINTELADSALASVEGITVAYDAQGQAIVRLSDQMDSLGDAYAQLEQQTRNKVIGDLPDVLTNAKTTLSGEESLTEQLRMAQYLWDVYVQGGAEPEKFKWNDQAAREVMQAAGWDGKGDFVEALLYEQNSLATQEALQAKITELQASIETTLIPVRDGMKAVASATWEASEYKDLPNAVKSLALMYFDEVNSSSLSNKSSNDIIREAQSFAQLFADPALYTAVENLYGLQAKFSKGDLTYGDYMSRAATEANKFVSDEMPDLFEQLVMEVFGLDGASTHSRNVNHLQAVVSDYSEAWASGLTANQLSFANTIKSGDTLTQAEYMAAYDESVKEAALSVATLSENYTKLTEAQTSAAEILDAVGTAGSMTLDQYKQLLAASEDYAEAIDTSTGYMTVNWEKLREINRNKLSEQQKIHQEALAENAARQAELRVEFDDLYTKAQVEAVTEAERERLTVLEEELNVLIKEGNQLQANLSDIKYMNSAYKQWLDAQEAGEKSDAFKAAKEAIEQIREGDKSGRRNTNKYQAALEYILGDAAYRASSSISKETALKRAESWYDDDGNFDLNAFRRSSIEAGAQKTTGEWTVANIAEYAKVMGVSQEYMAQAILALSEYNGFEGVNVSQALQDQAKELLPVDPVDANTEAIITNTEALETIAGLLEEASAQKQEAGTSAPSNLGETEEASGSNAVSEAQSVIDRLIEISNKSLDLRIEQQALEYAKQLSSVLELLNGMPAEGYTINVQEGNEVADAQAALTAIEGAIAVIQGLPDEVLPVNVKAELIGELTNQWNTITKSLEEYNNGAKTANVTVNATDNATTEIEGITNPDTPYCASIAVGLNPDTVTATEKEIARLQQEIDDLEIELGVSDAKSTVSKIEQAAAQGKTLDSALSELGIDMQSVLKAYGLANNMPLSENGLRLLYDQMLQKAGYPIGGVRTESSADKELSQTEKQTADMLAALNQLQEFAGVFEKSGYDLDAAMAEADVSMSELAKLLSQFTQVEKDEAAVREHFQGVANLAQKKGQGATAFEASPDIPTLDANRLEAIIVATREANGDLSAALDSLGMTYQQAGEVYSRMFTIPEGSDPYVELQKYVEEQAEIEVLVGANTDPAIQAANATVEAINKKTAYINVKTRQANTLGGLFSFAKGTRNAPGGASLVAEAGPEIVVDRKDGTWFLAKEPQLVDLNPGDIVLNNDETQRALSGKANAKGRAYGEGTGFFAGIISNVLDAAKNLASQVQTKVTSVFSSGSGNTNGRVTNSSGGNASSGPNYNAILEKFEQLHDWIERALAVAQEKTQDIIDNIHDFVGYVAQNKQVNKALAATRKEIELNQQAYVRYMEQAADVQDQLDLSNEIVQKIHEGVIDIESYDETTQKKIAEYQEWYEKAEATLDTVKELKKQERELQLQRMDNIIEDYENRLDQLDDQSAKIQREIEYQKAAGIEVQTSAYDELILGEQRKIANLQRERIALEAEFNSLVASGVLEVGSEDWHKYRNELESVDEAIHEATISAQEFADEIFNLNLSKLQNLNKILQGIQSSTEGIMSLHDAQGTKNVSEYYETLITNGHDQIANLEEQNELIREQMAGLEVESEKYQELLSELMANEEAITGIKVSQEQWNDSIADLKIENLQDEREALEKTNEAYQKQLDLEEALEALAKAKNQRTKLVYREGRGFVYEADQDAIDAAQKQVDDLMHQAQLDAIDAEIEAIEDHKQDDNVWSYDGSTLLKSNGLMPETITTAIKEMLSATLPEEVYAQTAVTESMKATTPQQSVPAISIGDIYVSDVNNAEDLAKDIVRNLPNAILQKMHKS